jgi:phage shock protein PspC (stress-responsive transcriptional regulator)
MMKRIYRLESGKKIAGICAGIGDAYNIDPNIVRIALVFLTVATFIWPAVVAYIAGWVLLPEKHELPPNS